MKQSGYPRIQFSDKMEDSRCPTENRQQSKNSPESSEEDRNLTVTACTGNDAIRNQEHNAG